VRSTGGGRENIDQQGYCGVSRAWSLALSAEKSSDLGMASFASFASRGSFWCWRCFVFDPAWEVQLDTLSCMSTSIQSD